MTSICGQEGHVQMAGLAQLQVILLSQQISPAYELIQAAHAQSGQANAHFLRHKGKEVHLQHVIEADAHQDAFTLRATCPRT